MKRIISILLIILMIGSLYGCNNKEEINKYEDNTDKNIEFSIDLNKYKEEFSKYLNSGLRDGEYDNIDKSIVDEGLFKSTPNEELSEKIPEESMPNSIPDSEIAGNEEDNGREDYPIFDSKGNVVDYGTKEESDKSYEEYNNAEYYQIEYAKAYYDRILFTIYVKGSNKTILYEAKLENGKIVSYNTLRIGV